MKKEKGVLILCWFHPFYGNYAAQLAASIKYTCPDLPITLLYHGNAINHFADIHRSFFDEIKPIPDACFFSNGVHQPFVAKLYAYSLSPYQHTIQLDADMIMFPKGRNLNSIFEQLKDVDFTIQNRSNYDINSSLKPEMWADLQEIKEKYKVESGNLFYVSSEFIYYKKTKENQTLFRNAVKTFDTLKVQYKRFAGGVPDELPLSIAMLCQGIKPHQEAYRPIYWESAEKRNLGTTELYGLKSTGEYIGYSIGGHLPSSRKMVDVYNQLAQFFAAKYGFIPFPFKEKRSFIPQRANI